MKSKLLYPIYWLICLLGLTLLLLPGMSRANGFPRADDATHRNMPEQNDAVIASNASYPCSGDGIYLYEDINYGGTCLKWMSDDSELGDDGFHDLASAIRFVGSYAGGRYRATLYEHHSYTGASTTFNADDPWLGDDAIGNDRADSIRIQQVPFCDLVNEIPKVECEALVSFYNATFGPYWTNRGDWLATYTPCSWYGITCYGGHVSRIQLIANNLSGSLPATLGDLTWLSYLRMDRNQLGGSIPATLGNLTQLYELDLSYNRLTGSLPDSIGNLVNIFKLYIVSNPLSGPLPRSLMSTSPAFFYFNDTNLCEPPDSAFQTWLESIIWLGRTGVPCAVTTPTSGPSLYLPLLHKP